MEPPLTKAEPVDEPKPFHVQTLESIMVFITMVASERCTICRMVVLGGRLVVSGVIYWSRCIEGLVVVYIVYIGC